MSQIQPVHLYLAVQSHEHGRNDARKICRSLRGVLERGRRDLWQQYLLPALFCKYSIISRLSRAQHLSVAWKLLLLPISDRDCWTAIFMCHMDALPACRRFMHRCSLTYIISSRLISPINHTPQSTEDIAFSEATNCWAFVKLARSLLVKQFLLSFALFLLSSSASSPTLSTQYTTLWKWLRWLPK